MICKAPILPNATDGNNSNGVAAADPIKGKQWIIWDNLSVVSNTKSIIFHAKFMISNTKS